MSACALALATGLALTGAPGLSVAANAPAAVLLAANADNPYGNVDHRNDAGNDTGNGKVDQLNAGQLDQNFKGPHTYRGTDPGAGATTDGAPAAAPPPQPR